MRTRIAVGLTLLLLLCVTGFTGTKSTANGQEPDVRSRLEGRFHPVDVPGRPAVIHGPFRLSARRLARLAERPRRRDRSAAIPETVGDDDQSAPCMDCGAGTFFKPEPFIEPRQTPDLTSKFFSNLGVSDPQIAASRSFLLVVLYNQLAFFTKDGTQLQPAIATIDFFQPLTDSINDSLVVPADLDPAIWKIDSYYDMRAIFDPYRNRFWISGIVANSLAYGTPNRRNKMVTAVSSTDDPRDDWYLYWSNAVSDDYAWAPDCTEISGVDYPSIGISPGYFLQEIGGGVNAAGKNYSHVLVVDANVLAAGTFCNPCSAFEFGQPSGTVGAFKMPDGCDQRWGSDILLQPAIHHSDPFGLQLFASVFVYPDPGSPNCNGGQTRSANDPDKYNLVVWALDLNGPPQFFTLVVPVAAFTPRPPQKPGYPGITQMDAEQPPKAKVTTPNFLWMGNLRGIALKAAYRDGLLHVTWQDCVKWESSNTCYTSIRVVRLDIFSPSNSALVDRTFGLRNVFDDGPGDFVYYGVPAVEVNKDGHMVVVYQRVGNTVFPEARYSIYLSQDSDILPSRALQVGDFPIGANAASSGPVLKGNLDVGGITVDPYDDTAVWMAHGFGTQFSTKAGTYGLVIGKVFGSKRADLVVALGSLQNTIEQGQFMRVRLTVKNQGDGNAEATAVRLLLIPVQDQTPGNDPIVLTLRRDEVAPLGSGETTTIAVVGTIPPATPPGPYHVQAVVDPGGLVVEYNDDNNGDVSATRLHVKRAHR